MIAIFKREVRAYFQTVIGWLFLAVLLAVFGLYFYLYNLNYGYPYISYSIKAIGFVLLIIVPILTMRSFAEERKNKTDQLILTAPVTVGQIVAGKYLAMLTIFALDVAVIAVMSLVLSGFGTVPMGENCLAILGFFLYGAALLAVGMFISSLTENIVIAAVVSFGVLFLSYMMQSICQMISANGNAVTVVLEAFDLYRPFLNFQSGYLKLTSLIYYISVIALLCFLTVQSVQKRRWSINRKTLSTGVFSLTSIALATAIAIAVNLIAGILPETVNTIDCSYSKVYALTDTTRDFLNDLKEDIRIYVLASRKSADSQISETLELYQSLSEHIKVEYVDTAADPSFYKDYTDANPTAGSLIVAGEKRAKVIDYFDIYLYSYHLDSETSSYSSELSGYDAEGQISSAIEYVTMESDDLPKVYTITGHGEAEIGANFTQALTKANVETEELELMKMDVVPEDAAVLIINGPQQDLNEADAQKIRTYLENGGSVLIAVDYGFSELANLNGILKGYGITPTIDAVQENNSQYYYGGNPLYLLPTVDYTPYTESVYGAYVFAPFSVALDCHVVEGKNNLTFYQMLESSDEAVCNEAEGSYILAVAVEDADTGAKIVAYGSTYLLLDDADSVVSSNDSKLFTNCISCLTGATEMTCAVIPAKEYTLSNLTIPSMTALTGGVIIMAVIPVIMILIGLGIWLIRRKE